MTGRALAAVLLASSLAAGDDLNLSASCDGDGNLVLHGEGPFASGETVQIRILRVNGTSREFKASKQVQSNARSFDAMIEPGNLPPGSYVVEVHVGALAAAVAVKLSSLKAIEQAREQEETVLLTWYGRVKRAAKGMEEALGIASEEARFDRLRAFERGLSELLKDIDRREVSQIPQAKQALKELSMLLVTLSKVHRGVADEEIGDLLKKHMVLLPDGTPKDVSEVFETGRHDLACSLAEAFTDVVRKSIEELDSAMVKAQSEKKGDVAFRAAAPAWSGRVTKTCDREKANLAPDGPYPDAVARDLADLRSALRELAEAQVATLDRDTAVDAMNAVGKLRQRIEERLGQLALHVRQ